jgi:phosphohistidine phosphatase
MDQLILMRHAKAVPAEGAPDDHARALAARGHADAAAAGVALARTGLAPTLALVSTARRTRETFDGVRPHLGDCAVRFVDALYDAEAETIFNIAVRDGAGTACVLVIGHNPGLHDLAAWLVRDAADGSRLARNVLAGFPTSAFAAFAVNGDVFRAPGARLLDAYAPRRD